MRLVHENEADETENHIHDHAGRDDRHALPDRLVLEGTRIVVFFLTLGSLTKHLDVAAQREPGNLVKRLPLLEAATRNCWTKADTERFHVHVTPLGDGEMAKLMDENDKAQSDSNQRDADHAVETELAKQDEYGDRKQSDQNRLIQTEWAFGGLRLGRPGPQSLGDQIKETLFDAGCHALRHPVPGVA